MHHTSETETARPIVMETPLYLHCATCRWHGEVLADAAGSCPACGSDAVGFTAIQAPERASDSPSEFVLSASQKQHPWRPEFWARLARRIADGEIVFDLRELARRFLNFIPGTRDRRSPGRPQGTGALRDAAHLERLRCDQEQPPMPASQRNLAGLLMYSHLRTRNIDVAEQTLRNNLRRFGLDLEDIRRRARHPRP